VKAVKIRNILLLSSALALGATGCTLTAYPDPVDVEVDYVPPRYRGYVVYYDDYGTPYYYVGTRIRYVPRTYVHYDTLRGHYHRHRPAYRGWYDRDGYRGDHRHHRPARRYRR
jgi:hypothetical protein